MGLMFTEGQAIKEFFVHNGKGFEEKLLKEAVNVRGKIEEIQQIGNINLVSNAHKLVLYVVEKREDELIAFARQEGIAWAKYSLTLSFKLEWIQAIRRTLWNFLYKFDQLNDKASGREDFYEMEKTVNGQIDLFLNCFFISYSEYKDKLIESQRELVENLSVPIIPLTTKICVLPLIGSIDSYRAKAIEEKVLIEIANLSIQILIIDLSGIAHMEAEVIHQLLKIFDGISMMGCKVVITGLRPEIVRKVIHTGISFHNKAELKGTLQQAVKDYVACQ